MQTHSTTDAIVELLLPMWTDVLGTPATPQSDFFALGGTSFSAMMIADALAERYAQCEGVALCALQAMFERPTLLEVAEQVSALVGEQEPA